MRHRRVACQIAFGSTLLLGSACNDTASHEVASSVKIVSGDGQSGPALAPLPTQLVVEVDDQNQHGVPLAAVDWVAASANGQASPVSSTTDNQGHAATTWTLGPRIGPQQLTAGGTICNTCATTFTATGTAPPGSALVAVGSVNINGTAGTVVQPPPAVKAQAPGGVGLGNAHVTFTADPKGGIVAVRSAVT